MKSDRIRAAQAGETQYNTGKACKHGHLSPRYTASGCCVECAKIRATAHQKKVREMISSANSDA